MKIKKYPFFILLLSILFLYLSITTASWSAENEKLWSFDFKNCTASEALRQISEASGILIIATGTIEKEILSKSYTNKRLDVILTDLLRGENYAFVWSYSGKGLDSIGLWSFEKGSKGGWSVVSDINRKATVDKNVRRTGNKKERINQNINLTKRATQNKTITNKNLSKSDRLFKNSNIQTQRTEKQKENQTLSDIYRSAIRKSRNAYSNNEKEGKQEDSQPSSQKPEQPEKQDEGQRLEPPPMPPGL